MSRLVIVPPRKRACSECPFVIGTPLNLSLKAGRLDDFKETVDTRGWFPCHKTSEKRMSLTSIHDSVLDKELGVTSWDRLPLEDKLTIACKEQECVGAVIWKKHGRAPTSEEVD